jgi:hypothetical protein
MTKRYKQREPKRKSDALTLRKRFETTDQLIVKTSIIQAIVRLGARLKEREDRMHAVGAQLRRMRDGDVDSNTVKHTLRLIKQLASSVARMPKDRKQLDCAYLEELLLEVGVQVCVINQIEQDLRWAQASALLCSQDSRLVW